MAIGKAHLGRLIGMQAEAFVEEGFFNAGWGVAKGPSLDYGGKTDMLALCEGGEQVPVQVSVSQKSSRQRARLEGAGILPVAVDTLLRHGVTPAQYVCGACVVSATCSVSEVPGL